MAERRAASSGEAAERVLSRLLRAEAALERSQARAARLRVKLARAEEKMARRAERANVARAALLETTDLAQAAGRDGAPGAEAPGQGVV